MNTAVIYSSKYGCTIDCANYIKAGLPAKVTLVNIDTTNSQSIDLEMYDTIILGSSIYIGAISKKMRTFCKERMDLLSRKKVGLFLCCAYPEEAAEYFSKIFPPALLKNAVAVKEFGGEARIEKMNTIDKLIMKAVTKGNRDSLKLLYENMDCFIRELSN